MTDAAPTSTSRQRAASTLDDGRTPKMTARDVHVFYGDKEALKGVGIDIHDDRVTAFIGPSGCGKSTFLRCLNRMNDTIPSARVDGRDRARRPEHQFARRWTSSSCAPASAWCSRSPTPSPSRSTRMSPTARASTASPRARPSSTRSSRSRCAAPACGTRSRTACRKAARRLSGGQQQRLCIARAIAVDPEVILMDEPCSALDPIATAKIEELIHELRGRYAIAIVTHNMQQAARVSQRTAFFHLGEMVEYGKTSEIFTNPREQRTQDYITGRYG